MLRPSQRGISGIPPHNEIGIRSSSQGNVNESAEQLYEMGRCVAAKFVAADQQVLCPNSVRETKIDSSEFDIMSPVVTVYRGSNGWGCENVLASKSLIWVG
jgi:hypothetical protein